MGRRKKQEKKKVSIDNLQLVYEGLESGNKEGSSSNRKITHEAKFKILITYNK